MKAMLYSGLPLWVLAGLLSVGAVAEGQAPGLRPGTPPDLGANASLHGSRLLPADNPWNQDVSQEPVDPDSAALIASIGPDKPLHPDWGTRYGIPYVVVAGRQPRVPVEFQYKDESDPGPYPLPPDAPIEGGAGAPADSDRHVLVLDRDAWRLYELWNAFPLEGGRRWRAGSGAIFDLKSNRLRPAGWTSADAAGLPILPGLVRYDEVAAGEITHAVRFTCVKTRRAYLPPATHFASQRTAAHLPPMGLRVRLRADYDIRKFPAQAQIVLRALKKHGMILADNGGDWFVTGAPSPRWDDEALNTLKQVKGRNFEVVRMGRIITK